jgi:hypothetical protein
MKSTEKRPLLKTATTVFVFLALLFSATVYGQVSINNDGSAADASAVLDVSSTDKGLLIPRMSATERDAIDSPVTGLMVYVTDDNTFYSYDGSAWKTIGSQKYSVGDFAQGGVVFYVDETGEHGLVCAKDDQATPPGTKWYAGTYLYTMATGEGVYSGEMNTALIVARQEFGDGTNYAALVCAELEVTENGESYGDWYLPSRYELNLIYENKATINATATANGGTALQEDYYYSSTETSHNSVWRQNLLNGYQVGNASKQNSDNVRAIRAF